jgi:hypothetical protein
VVDVGRAWEVGDDWKMIRDGISRGIWIDILVEKVGIDVSQVQTLILSFMATMHV